jgi:Selenocysteine lyase
MINIESIRQDFPILQREVYGKPLIYFDNGATTQKPRCMVESITEQYYSVNANVHRGVHFLSQQATELHEGSRKTVQQFINRPQYKRDYLYPRHNRVYQPFGIQLWGRILQ